MDPKYSQEEVPEGVEHLDKEVPPKANVRGKIWEK